MMRHSSFVIGALLVTSLAIQTARARPVCASTLRGDIPLRNDALFLHVPVELAHQSRSMIIDTGSEGSLITPRTADALALPNDPHRRTVISGPDGRSDLVPNRVARHLRLGGVEFGEWSFPLGILPNLPKSLEALSGLIGADLLQDFAVEFDAPHRRFRLWQFKLNSGQCDPEPPRAYAGSQDTAHWVRLRAHQRGLRLNVVFSLDGVRGNALIDSGARSITLSRRFANQMGISNQMLSKDRGGITSGVDLNARRFYWHRFQNLTLASDASTAQMALISLKAPVITVSEIDDDADMLLGADFISRHDVFVSFQTSAVFVR